MAKSISSALAAHLAGEVTTLATCWRVTRKDGREFFFTDHDREGWVLGSGTGTSHTQLGLYRIKVAATAFYDPLTSLTFGVDWDKVATFLPADIEAGAGAFCGEAGGLTYDATDNGVFFQVRIAPVGGTIYTIKWRDGDGIVWKTATPIQINYEGPFFGGSRLTRQRWSLIRSTRVIQLDTATGELVADEAWPDQVDEWGAQVYDAETDTILVQGDIGWVKLARAAGEVVVVDEMHAILPAARHRIADRVVSAADRLRVVDEYFNPAERRFELERHVRFLR